MKVRRASKHLDKLKSEISSFRDKAYSVTTKDDVEKGGHIVRIEQAETPESVAMLIGEFAYSMRSALDHLAWQLALLTTDKPGRQTAFPIESECPLPSNKGYAEKIANIPPVPLGVIESLQPYKAGAAFKSHPLWQLNKLCNIDKHQVVAISYIHFAVRIDGVSTARRRDLDHVIEIVVPLAQKDDLQLKIDVPGIVFGQPIDTTDAVPDFEIGLNGLLEIYNFVGFEVVPRFARFFT
ncbi:MAG: hypothetical protein WCE73_11285 [Candidatus Angelobacter sp.]